MSTETFTFSIPAEKMAQRGNGESMVKVRTSSLTETQIGDEESLLQEEWAATV
jgi:hypothetical protein